MLAEDARGRIVVAVSIIVAITIIIIIIIITSTSTTPPHAPTHANVPHHCLQHLRPNCDPHTLLINKRHVTRVTCDTGDM